MIRINNLRVPLDFDFSELKRLCTKKLGIDGRKIRSVRLSKKSVDARRKNDVHFIISVDIEAENEDKLLKSVTEAVAVTPYNYEINRISSVGQRPVIVGFGPAGMFAALVLAESGAKPVILERGGDVDSRCAAVELFQSTGKLDYECNIQFGEGGAGTFSDGKLTTGIKDKRIGYIFRRLVEFGAPDEILYMAKPHIGTDKLRRAVKNLREYIISLGAEVMFNSRFCDFESENGEISAVKFDRGGREHTIKTNNVILAAGHSSRDVFELLYDKNIDMSQKNFSVGVRIEHLRTEIDSAMYGSFAGHKALKAADYKLAVHLPNGRTLYTFCMCPGGYVVAASSEKNRLAVNGMSRFARNAENSNSALLVGVSAEDYGSDHPLAGMHFQRRLEEKAFLAGGGAYSAPVTSVGDFLSNRTAAQLGKVRPSYMPSVKLASPDEYLPDFVCETLRLGIREMGRKIKGFDAPDAVLTGIESRSSSPVRINRGADLQSLSMKGLFPCGEGAGYAGGIVSAAVDGMKCAEAVIEQLKRPVDERNIINQ